MKKILKTAKAKKSKPVKVYVGLNKEINTPEKAAEAMLDALMKKVEKKFLRSRQEKYTAFLDYPTNGWKPILFVLL